MEYDNRSFKFLLPNGNVVDLLFEVLNEMTTWKQHDFHCPERCGFILGYKNYLTNNITLSASTSPKSNWLNSPVFCKLITHAHLQQILENKRKKNYYMGTWHTHPQSVPEPSMTDWTDWRETLEKDRTGSEYAFFIIIGLEEFRVWAGSFQTKEISELVEAPITDGIYAGEVGNSEYENQMATHL